MVGGMETRYRDNEEEKKRVLARQGRRGKEVISCFEEAQV